MKRKTDSKDDFFSLLSEGANYMDKNTVESVFYSLIRLMGRELRGKHTVTLPEWGTFSLIIHKSRRSRDVNTGNIIIIPPQPTIKFTPNKNLRKYFQDLNISESDVK